MALQFSRYMGEIVPGGALIDSASIASDAVTTAKIADSGITTAKIASGAVTGAKSSLTSQYVTLAVGTSGTTAVYPFGTSTAPVAGTVTGYWTVGGTAAGTFTLWATTAGTIATIVSSGTTGTFTGTRVLNATIAAGDTVQVSGTDATGVAQAFVTFRTVN